MQGIQAPAGRSAETVSYTHLDVYKRQGLPTLRVADLVQDTRTLKVAQEEAKALLAVDPNLVMPEHRELSDEVERLFATAGAMN